MAASYQQLPAELHAATGAASGQGILLAIATEDHTAAILDSLPVSLSDVARNRLLPLTPAARERMDTAGAAGDHHCARTPGLLDSVSELTSVLVSALAYRVAGCDPSTRAAGCGFGAAARCGC